MRKLVFVGKPLGPASSPSEVIGFSQVRDDSIFGKRADISAVLSSAMVRGVHQTAAITRSGYRK